MIAGHLVAAVVTVAALHRGERMLRTLARGIRRLLRVRLQAPRPLVRRRLAATVLAPSALRPAILPSDLSLRGPPPRVALVVL